MSTYEDIGLSYVDFDTTSKYGTITLANPIGTTESFFLAVKFRSFNGAVNTRIISVGASTTTVISAYCHSTTTIYLKRVCASGEDVSTANGFGASYGNDGEDHIAVLHITPTQQKIYLDSLSNVGSDSSLVGSLTEALTKITINSRVTSTTPDQIGKSRIYWAALYSALPDADITSLMSGAAPNTVGTLRSGDSFWAFNGSSAEYNGGTPFTMVGSPTFVQPAYTDTLDVIDSYLSLDSTQYAQAPIGATRIATKGDGTDVYGTIPVWEPGGAWEIEFDVVFPTTASSSYKTFYDSNDATKRKDLMLGTTGLFVVTSYASAYYLDGTDITATLASTAHPLDGAVHHMKITGTTASVKVGKLLAKYDNNNKNTSIMFNVRLTDISNSANSRFYPMDETTAASTFLDTSANAQHGTWTGRVAGDVITVYPGAIEYGQEVYFALKWKILDNSLNSGFNFLASLGLSVTSDLYYIYIPESNGQVGFVSYKNNVKIAEKFGIDLGTTHVDGKDHTAVFHINTDGSMEFWVDNSAASTLSTTNTFTMLTHLHLNGRMAGLGVRQSAPKSQIYWAYLYNTLSLADINALMQGEHPASVGNVRQGYNLLGDGSEVNGGPALTLYGDPDFYVPRRNGLTFPLTSSLVSSFTSPLVSR